MFDISKKQSLLLYLFIVFVGIITIWFQLNYDDFWLDEMSSFWISDPFISFEETIYRHKNFDWHNPLLFNLILKEFLNFTGYDPSYARYLTLLFGSIVIIFFGILSREIKNDNSFLISTFLASISIYIIKYSQELRPYSLLLMLSIINIYLYYKITNQFIVKKKINNFVIISFVVISTMNYSTNPFSLIILFSQITNSLSNFLFFKKKDKFFFFSLFPIIFFYFLLNFDYILLQLNFNEYMLSSDIKNVIDGLYFPRFFGSKIMGYLYLVTLLFLIFYHRKKIFFKKNKYLLLFIIFLFSYLVPLLYALIKAPVLHDRYILFVLIPIILLISCLSAEIESKKIKTSIIFVILTSTLVNHYLEIFNREYKKPEFNNIIKEISKSSHKDIVFYDKTMTSNFVYNYFKNLNPQIQEDFNIYQFKNELPNKLSSFWLLCYTPRVDFNCNISSTKSWKLTETKKKFLIEAKLFIKN